MIPLLRMLKLIEMYNAIEVSIPSLEGVGVDQNAEIGKVHWDL